MTAAHVTVLEPPSPVPLALAAGPCAVAWTTNPYAMQPPTFECYAILASWLPVDAPVGMLVTFNNFRGSPDAAPFREVNTVYADPAFRGLADPDDATVSVLVGRWLFETGLLTRHSPDRTDAGNRWAMAVGGELPERHQKGTAANADSHGASALARLNRIELDPL